MWAHYLLSLLLLNAAISPACAPDCTTMSPMNGRPDAGPCPPGMALVSGGPFLTGADPRELNISPMGHALGFVPRSPRVADTGPFCMDRYEFPNRAGVLPRGSITFTGARAECLSRGRRLCTEAEFERACGGPDGWPQPYGEFYDPGRCNNYAVSAVGDGRWLAPSGAFWGCMSPEGVFDLEGNLSEWVDAPFPIRYSGEGNDQEHVVRGGTMWQAIYGAGCSSRHSHPDPGPEHLDDGFRCCADPIPPGSAAQRLEQTL